MFHSHRRSYFATVCQRSLSWRFHLGAIVIFGSLLCAREATADGVESTDHSLLVLLAGDDPPPVTDEETKSFIDQVGDFLFSEPPNRAETGGRGLLTTQGPSGTYLNPTSGTLPETDFTFQYCTVYPDNSASGLQPHGLMAAYGVTDWLEIGVLATYLDFKGQPDKWGAGPLVRVRLTKQEGMIPQVSVGAYSRFGDIEDHSIFTAAYYRFEIDPEGIVQAVGLHVGLRETWVGNDGDVSGWPVAYTAVEVELPYHFSFFAEVSTRDPDTGGTAIPFGVGLQWRYGVINITVSVLNTGAFNEPSFFWGIGPQWSF